MNKNIIAFKKGFIVCFPGKNSNSSEQFKLVSTLNVELMQFGYSLDKIAYANLVKSPKSFIIKLHNDLIGYLKEFVGDGKYTPFHKNFPESVINKTNAELIYQMILNYFSCDEWTPNEKVSKRYTFEHSNFKLITSKSENDFLDIFTNLVQSNIPLNQDDFKIIEWFVKSYKIYNMPDTINLKENLCMLASLGIDVPVKTSTDVLRIAQYLSNGSTVVSLPPKYKKYDKNPDYEKFHFIKFNRKQRAYLLNLINKVGNSKEMVYKINRWIKLGEILHPGEKKYKKKYPNAFKVFNELRNYKVKSWEADVDAKFKVSFSKGLKKLSERPGMFSRRLDSLLRNNINEQDEILDTFQRIGDKVSNKVLFELLNHFETRNTKNIRSLYVNNKLRVLPTLDILDQKTINFITSTIWNILKLKFSKLPKLGNVWIDKKIDKIPLPSDLKTLSPTLVPVIRGERIKLINVDNILRAYIHYNNPKGSHCIDLSAILIDKKEKEYALNWTNHTILKSTAIHSGDSYNRSGNVAEYVDIDISKALKRDIKYVIVYLHNYNNTRELMNNTHNFGFLGVEHQTKSKTWLPSKIENSFKINGVENKYIACLIDIKTKEYIIIDRKTDSNGILINSEFFKNLAEKPKFSVYDLLKLHVEARGKLVKDKNDSDIIFEYDTFAKDYSEIIKYMI